jgi:VanZ family protein
MSLEIVDEQERGAKTGLRGLPWSLFAIPRTYPISWAIAWTALLLGLCLAPERVMPDEDSVPIKKYIPHADLAVHWTLFAGFAVSWIRAGRRPLRWVAIPVLGLLLAVGTEYAQGLPFIDRDASVLDGLFDVVGVVMGSVGSALLGRRSAVTSGHAPGQ